MPKQRMLKEIEEIKRLKRILIIALWNIKHMTK